MHRRLRLTVLVGLATLILLISLGGALPGPESRAEPAASLTTGDSDGPVLVELFTSQGCSSCPSADRMLSKLADDGAKDVVPLAFHVDYWNYIGWRDPFSSNAWSQRQRRYARSLGHGRVFTPQLVVDGGSDCVGSDADAALRQIAQARRRASRAQLRLKLDGVPGSSRLQAEVTATLAEGGRLELMTAVFENGLETAVKRGENARRTLHNDFVVRRLERWATLQEGVTAWSSGRREVALDPEWDVEQLGIAVFVQDPERLTIHGAAVARLGKD